MSSAITISERRAPAWREGKARPGCLLYESKQDAAIGSRSLAFAVPLAES